MISNLINPTELPQWLNSYPMLSSQQMEWDKILVQAIADIVLQVNFSSQSHLTQHFKRLIGMTPKQIR